MIKEFFQSLLFGLLPPELPYNENGPPSKEATLQYRKEKRRWNRTVAMALWFILLTGGFHVVWACGWLSGVSGFKGSGFALASEQSRNTSALAEIVASQLRLELRDTRRLHCEAIKDVAAGFDASRQRVSEYYKQLEDLKRRYREVTGETWEQPACGEL